MRVVIWTGAAYEPWGPSSIDAGGIGGSETAAIHVAGELARRGHQVFLFGEHRGMEIENVVGEKGTVEYVDYHRALEDPKLLAADVFVSSRDKSILRIKPDAKVKVLWVHDVHVGDDWHDEVPLFDRVYCLTRWHRRFFLDHYPSVDEERVTVTRNGVDPARFEPNLPWEELRAKKKPSFVWSSSLDRGLDVMMDLWPQIKELEPAATLDVYYGIDNWRKLNADSPVGLATIDYFMARIESMTGNGVTYRGRVGQRELARAHMGALIWAYPTAWAETSCITALEAQAAGCFPIASAYAALPETVHSGFLVPGRNKSVAYKDLFFRYVREVLTGVAEMEYRDALDHDLVRRGNRELMLTERTWAGVAQEWEADFKKLLREK